MSKPEVNVDYQVQVELADIPSCDDIQRWLNTVTQVVPVEQDILEVSVLVTTVEQSQQLNKEYRGKDKPTNVLSFPADVPEYLKIPLIGDLVVCHQVVINEAMEQGKSVRAHWAHMVIHGLLHLLGYDHETDDEAEIMEALEIEALAKLGIADPYQL
ncbi:MAG: rRNA maturation RNase YbeY [Gammaproteobacteria bacterium]|nr:rRNA maturation RNase YbeY [Gammaproteobacteria bacterium]